MTQMQERSNNVEELFRDFSDSVGIKLPDHIMMDGKIHRFDIKRKGDKRGAYQAHSDGSPNGWIQDWAGDKHNWRSGFFTGAPTPVKPFMQESKNDMGFLSSEYVRKYSDGSIHPYLVSKGITSWFNSLCARTISGSHDGVNVSGGIVPGGKMSQRQALIIPLINKEGEIESAQFIYEKSGGFEKRFMEGAHVKGCFSLLNNPLSVKDIVIGEGFATVASVLQDDFSKGKDVLGVMSASASNIPDVAVIMREKHPNARIILLQDNDGNGVGKEYCEKASSLVNGVVCPIPDMLDLDASDWNDVLSCAEHVSFAECVDRNDSTDCLESWVDSCDSCASTKYYLKGFLESGSHGVLFGSSGSFKSFTIIDMLASFSSSSDWMGFKARNTGKVLYVCGEGAGGLPRRLKAVQKYKGTITANALTYKKRIDFSEPSSIGLLKRVIADIKPKIVVFDTVSSLGAIENENDNSQVSKFMANIKSLFEGTDCSSILVHHTGKSSTGKARGAGAFYDNSDFVWKLEGDGDMAVRISCEKAKDDERFKDVELTVESGGIGVFDEDGSELTSLYVLKKDMDFKRAEDKPLSARQQIGIDSIKACKHSDEGRLSLSLTPGAHVVARKDFDIKVGKILGSGERGGLLRDLKQKGLLGYDRNYIWLLDYLD